MPFTLAHPAAAIPLRRVLGRASVLSALIIGSLSPDLGYFIPLGINRATSHSLAGLFWFCIPAGFVVYLLFHVLLRPVGYYLLPPLRDRLPLPPDGSWLPASPLWAVLVSLTVGAATHLLWDAFTHKGGFVVAEFPAFRALLWEVGGYRVYTYKVLQHGSTLVGLSLLALWGWQWFIATRRVHHEPRGGQPPEAVRVPALLLLLAVPALGGLISGVWHIRNATGMKALQQFVRHGVITAMGVFGTILLGLGVLWRLWEARVVPRNNRR